MEDPKRTNQEDGFTPEEQVSEEQLPEEQLLEEPLPEEQLPEEQPPEEQPSEEQASEEPVPEKPIRPQKNARQTVLLLVGSLLVLFLVYASTSLIYKVSRGESWNPFAFLKKTTTTEKKLPTVVTVPPQVLTSLIPETTTAVTATPVATTEAPATTDAPTTTEAPTTETPTTETPSAAETTATKATTTEAASTESPTAEPTTDSLTTDSTTTEAPTATDSPTTEAATAKESSTKATTKASSTEATDTPPATTEAEVFTELSVHLSQNTMTEDQLIGSQLIVAQGNADGHCMLYFYEKSGDAWTISEAVPVASGSIGKNRIVAEKPAGSTDIPAGYYALGPVFGFGGSALTHLPYQQIQEGDCWVTDPLSAYYNRLASPEGKKKDWNSALELSMLPQIYKYAILVNYNTLPVDPKLGTAVFLSVLGDTDSPASISLSEPSLFALLSWLKAEADPHILIYTYESHTQ